MRTSSLSNLAFSALSVSTVVRTAPLFVRQWSNTEAEVKPVINQDFPDPALIKTESCYYAFSTSSAGHNIQVAKTQDFQNPSWQVLDVDALPNPGSWTDQSHNIWAPNVAQTATETYVMYYAAPPSEDSTKHCVGTATSSSITGPYTPSDEPFACDLSIGGAIDPSIFHDPASGKTYIMYKVDGNSLGGNAPTPIRLQQVDPSDLVTRIGDEVTIFDHNGSDGSLVEAPAMMYENGVYFLLFSTGAYDTAAYDIRYVTSSSITGPFNSAQTVLLKTDDGNGVVAPGSPDIKDGMIVFHGTVNFNPLQRDMYAGYVDATGTTLRFTGFAN